MSFSAARASARKAAFRISAAWTACTTRNLTTRRKRSSATAFMRHGRRIFSSSTAKKCSPSALRRTSPTAYLPSGSRRAGCWPSSHRTSTACTRRQAASASTSCTAASCATTAPAAASSTPRSSSAMHRGSPAASAAASSSRTWCSMRRV